MNQGFNLLPLTLALSAIAPCIALLYTFHGVIPQGERGLSDTLLRRSDKVNLVPFASNLIVQEYLQSILTEPFRQSTLLL